MNRRLTHLRPLLALALVLALTAVAATTTLAGSRGSAGPSSAARHRAADSEIAPVPRPIYIYAGSCGDLGEVQWPLNNLISPNGVDGGSQDADRTEYSFTANVPLTIDQMLAGTYAINVHEGGERSDRSLSCGNIGGVADGVGTLVIGLREQDGSGITGIAVLSPSPSDPAMTYSSVFITGSALGDAVGTIEVTPPAEDDEPPVTDEPPIDDDDPVDDDDPIDDPDDDEDPVDDDDPVDGDDDDDDDRGHDGDDDGDDDDNSGPGDGDDSDDDNSGPGDGEDDRGGDEGGNDDD